MFYQIKRTALLEFIPLIDVSISIGTVEHKQIQTIKSYYLVADPLCAITAVSLWHIDITWSHPLKNFSKPLMQPIPIVTCFGEFLPLFSSSAGEILVQSDLNLEIDLGNLRLSISLPL